MYFWNTKQELSTVPTGGGAGMCSIGHPAFAWRKRKSKSDPSVPSAPVQLLMSIPGVTNVNHLPFQESGLSCELLRERQEVVNTKLIGAPKESEAGP